MVEWVMDNSFNERLRLLLVEAQRDPAMTADAGPCRRLEPENLQQVLDLIAEGQLDYSQVDSDGRSLWGVLTYFLDSPAQRLELTKAMMDQGGNPLMAEDEIEVLCRSTAVRMGLEGLLASQEALGKGLRDRRGGNLYHVLARIRYDLIFDLLALMADDQKNECDETVTHFQERRSWIRGTDDQGDTPLHALWSQEALDLALKLTDPTWRVVEAKRLNGCNIAITLDLISFGADILARNDLGRTPLDLMAERDLSQLDAGEAMALDKLRRVAELRMLEQSTPQAPVGHKLGLRL